MEVMLILKPKGPGNWNATTVTIEGPRLSAITLRPGGTFELGGVVWRIVEVRP
jgi:hypothetical protein